MHALNPQRIMDLAVISVVGLGWEMFDFGTNGVSRDEYTDATVRYMKSMQLPEGNWLVTQSRRPPMAAGMYQTAALVIYTLRKYGPPAEQADTEKTIARAITWLEAAKPTTTQDRAFHLLGLAWAGGGSTSVSAAMKSLAATQRPDGGWSQLPTMDSDSYATGQALYALNVAGNMPTSDSIYRKGVKYLLGSQAADGSWCVKSRSIWLQPYFDSGFPYERDQWISAAGTAWATMALSLTVEPGHFKINNLGWAKINRRNGPVSLANRTRTIGSGAISVRACAWPQILSSFRSAHLGYSLPYLHSAPVPMEELTITQEAVITHCL